MSKGNTRELILGTATRLFQENGFNSIGMSEIIKASGAPKGSLYYHFPNGKEQLIFEAIHHASQKIRDKVAEDLASSTDFKSALDVVITNMISSLESDQNEINYSISLMALESVGVSQELREASKAALHQMEQLYILKAKQDGLMDEQAESIGKFVQLVLEGAYTEALICRDRTILENAQLQLHHLLEMYSFREEDRS